MTPLTSAVSGRPCTSATLIGKQSVLLLSPPQQAALHTTMMKFSNILGGQSTTLLSEKCLDHSLCSQRQKISVVACLGRRICTAGGNSTFSLATSSGLNPKS